LGIQNLFTLPTAVLSRDARTAAFLGSSCDNALLTQHKHCYADLLRSVQSRGKRRHACVCLPM